MTQRGRNKKLELSQYFLGVTLLFQLLALVLIVSGTRLPVPSFALNSVKNAILEKGIVFSCKSVRFTLTGMLFAEAVSIRATNEKVPTLAEIDYLTMTSNPLSLLKGTLSKGKIALRGGQLMFNDNPEASPMLRKLDIDMDWEGHHSFATLTGRLGSSRIRFDAEADMSQLFPKRKQSAKIPFFMRPEFPKLYSTWIQGLEQIQSSLGSAKRSFIAGRLSKVDDNHLFSFDAQAEGNLNQEGVSFTKMMTHFSFRQREQSWRIEANPELRIFDGRLPGRGYATALKLSLREPNASLMELKRNLKAELRLEGFGIEGERDGKFDCIDAMIEIHDLDKLEASLLVKANRLYLDLDAKYQLSKRSGLIIGHGKLYPEDLHSALLQDLDQRGLFKAPEGVSLLSAKVSLGPRGVVKEAMFRATGRQVTYRGVRTDNAMATVQYKQGGDWALDPMKIKLGNHQIRGSYVRKSSRDYRFLVQGRVKPEEINPWMGDWWIQLWRDFKISSSPPAGDFEVAGRWGDPNNEKRKIFGSIQFGSLSYRNLLVESGRVIILADQNHTMANDLELDLKNGWASGELSRANNAKGHPPGTTRFSLEGSVTPSACIDLFGSKTRETLIKFESENLVEIKAAGEISQDQNESDFHLEINTSHPMRYAEIPLETLAFQFHRKGPVTRISDLSFQFAGGKGKGYLVNSGFNENSFLEISLELTNLTKKKVVEALRLSNLFAIVDENATTKAPLNSSDPSTDSKDSGILNFKFSAKGQPNDPLSFNGNGHIDLRDADLGSIRLLGPLSKVLRASPLPLPSGSVNFDRLKGPFNLEGDKVVFDELSITSSTAAIKVDGKLWLKDRRLEGDASFSLIGGLGSRIPPLGEIANKVDLLPKILKLKLFGSMEDPKWSRK